MTYKSVGDFDTFDARFAHFASGSTSQPSTDCALVLTLPTGEQGWYPVGSCDNIAARLWVLSMARIGQEDIFRENTTFEVRVTKVAEPSSYPKDVLFLVKLVQTEVPAYPLHSMMLRPPYDQCERIVLQTLVKCGTLWADLAQWLPEQDV